MSLTIAALFFIQTLSCFADHAGLLPCVDQASEQKSVSPKSGEKPLVLDCCGAHSCTIYVVTPLTLGGGEISEVLSPADDYSPDGLVQEIDHPPQLS